MAGLNILLIIGGANSAKNTAQQIPIGTPIITAPMVTVMEPTIIGKIPNKPLLGAHSIPKIKLNTPTCAIIGAPLEMINTVINANADIDERASRKNIFLDKCSLNFFIIL
jgi:hypothetical protein